MSLDEVNYCPVMSADVSHCQSMSVDVDQCQSMLFNVSWCRLMSPDVTPMVKHTRHNIGGHQLSSHVDACHCSLEYYDCTMYRKVGGSSPQNQKTNPVQGSSHGVFLPNGAETPLFPVLNKQVSESKSKN